MASRDLSSSGCTTRALQMYYRINWKMCSTMSRLSSRHASVIAEPCIHTEAL